MKSLSSSNPFERYSRWNILNLILTTSVCISYEYNEKLEFSEIPGISCRLNFHYTFNAKEIKIMYNTVVRRLIDMFSGFAHRLRGISVCFVQNFTEQILLNLFGNKINAESKSNDKEHVSFCCVKLKFIFRRSIRDDFVV